MVFGGNGDKGDKTSLEKELEGILRTDSTANAFGSQELLTAISMIIMADKDVKENVFRYNFPSYGHAVAAAYGYSKLKEHGYDAGIELLELLLGFTSAIKEQRIRDLVQAVIGQQQAERREHSSVSDRVKNWAMNR